VAAGKINPPRQAGPLTPVLIALLATEAEERPTATHARDMLAAVARGEKPDVPETRTLFAGPPTDGRTQVVHQPQSRSRTGVRPAAAPPPPPKSSGKRPLVAAAIALVAVLGVGGYLMATRDSGPQRPATSNVNNKQSTVYVTPETTAPETTETTKATAKQTTPKTQPPKNSEPPKTTETTTTPRQTTPSHTKPSGPTATASAPPPSSS
jgi:hypothetical protein